jgi:hypothetical protein
MNAHTNTTVSNVRLGDLEQIIRTAVRQEVQAEFARLLHTPSPVLLEYWLHEGPEDESDDQELVTEALEMLRAYQNDKSGWMSLEDFEAELARNEL